MATDDDFDAARAAFIAALDAHHAGRLDEAQALYLASLQRLPGRVSTLVNLAAVRLAMGRAADALEAADAALRHDATAADAWLHRATALAALDQPANAVTAFERLEALTPPGGASHQESLRRRAPLLERLSRPADALAVYDRLLAIAPDDAATWSARGSLLRETGRSADAAESYRHAIAAGADPALHGWYLAAVDGSAAPGEAPPGYVQTLFDGYADGFDDHLVDKLRYRAHERLVDGVAASGRGPFTSALDLGCGTGLVGALLRPAVARLAGVDVSRRMLDAARRRGVYDALAEADVVDHLLATSERHDLVIAADVLVYIGDLGPLFAALRRVLPHGLFALSVERAADPECDFALQPSLRYAHGEHALRRRAARHGWQVLRLERGTIREDQRRPIDGLYGWLAPG